MAHLTRSRRPGLQKAAGGAFALLAALSVSACANGQLEGLQVASADAGESDDGGSSASAYASAKPKQSEPFNPFREISGSESGRRQVIAMPTLEQVMETGPLPEMSLGRADAPVTVVKYASLTCPYCRRFQLNDFPRFKRAYIDTGKVRFILREFPIGRSSGNATIALRCVPKERYFDLYSKFLSQQGRWVSQDVRLEAIHKVAAQAGLSRAKFDACLQNQDLIQGLSWVKDRGRTLGIIGTPNFFIQNKLIKKVVSYEEFTALIDAELGSSRTLAVAN